MRLLLLSLALLAFPAAAAAQGQPTPPRAWTGDVELMSGSSCMQYEGGVGICGDTGADRLAQAPAVKVVPGETLPLRFDGTVDALIVHPADVGTLARVDASTWNLTLGPTLTGTSRVDLWATYVGPPKSGTASFHFRPSVEPAHFDFVQLRKSIVRAQFYVPATDTLRAYVTVKGKRRSAVWERIVVGAGVKALRVKVRGGAPRTARLVVRYTATGTAPVTLTERLRP